MNEYWIQRARSIQAFAKNLEPWGILLAVIGLGITLWTFKIEREDREEDRINRAISQFSERIGRIDALNVLIRNKVDLRYLVAPQAFIAGANLSGLDLTGANFESAIMDEVSFSKTILKKINFQHSSLENSKFVESKLVEISFKDANLVSANFSSAFFESVVIEYTSLHDTNFLNAHFMKTNFDNLLISSSNFSDASFYDVNFTDVVFEDVNFSGSNFQVVESLSGTTFCRVIMPDSSRCDLHCSIPGECSWLEEYPRLQIQVQLKK